MTLIVFEGNEKLGKTTVALEVVKRLEDEHYRYVKFPNEDIDSGKIIREILRNERVYEPYSFQALNSINKQNTYLKGNVIVDRYFISQIVYGVVDKVSPVFLAETCKYLPDPDLIFVFTGTPFCNDEEIFGEDTENLEKQYEKFLNYNKSDRSIIRINANKPVEETIEEIINHIKNMQVNI